MYEKKITLKDTCPVCGAKLNNFEYNVSGKSITFLKIDCDQCHTRFSYKPTGLDIIDYCTGKQRCAEKQLYDYDPEECWNGQS